MYDWRGATTFETSSEIRMLKFQQKSMEMLQSQEEGRDHAMLFKFIVAVGFLLASFEAAEGIGFRYNGFQSANLVLDGVAMITSNGLLKLTNDDTRQQIGHAFYSDPITFKNSPNGTAFSFSTTFVFAMASQFKILGGQGMAFVIAPQKGLPGAFPSQYIGLFSPTNTGNETNHVFAVELDTIENKEFRDINDNHVGIDINGLNSNKSEPAGYYPDDSPGSFANLTLISSQAMQVWVEYDGTEEQLNVTLAPIGIQKPRTPLMSLSINLSPIVKETMYVGFSSSTGSVLTFHYVLGWSFEMNGKAEELTISQLPKLPRVGKKSKSKLLTVGVPIMSTCLILAVISGVLYYVRRKRKFAEVLEDWEHDYGPHRFKYKDLYIATNGFRDLLGIGGFGRVYRGILPTSKIEIAVKKVSHESRQGIREFVSEVISIGHLRHRNLVSLLGYCRRKGELLLVYDYMPNGSFDKYLYDEPDVTLSWTQRFKIIKGVAAGLLYLHEGWDQVVIHRDIKASNVLLDAQLNGRLGDFGLARLYDHGAMPRTTNLMGTLGYVAPEHMRTGRGTKASDMFGFGAFLLEVATGRRPVEVRETEDLILVDWVVSCWNRGNILEARDPNMGEDFVAEEVEMVLKLGLMCSHSDPGARPSIRQLVQCLEGDVPMQDISSLSIPSSDSLFPHREGFDDFVMSYPSSMIEELAVSSNLSAGRRSMSA